MLNKCHLDYLGSSAEGNKQPEINTYKVNLTELEIIKNVQSRL